MRHKSNITSMALMLIVLLLGIFIPSLPDLDDGDDNVGCAAVMPVSTREASADDTSGQRKRRTSTDAAEGSAVTRASLNKLEIVAPAMIVLSQVTPPLRP